MVATLTKGGFPLVSQANALKTSPLTPSYNCIAWAANDNTRWWWPTPEGTNNYWPDGISRSNTVSSFVAAFQTLGYHLCATGDLEEEFEKVVLYVSEAQLPTHMARQLTSGEWTSKMGRWHDISHQLPETLNGPAYGAPFLFMRRARREI